MTFEKSKPYNSLPLLPPAKDVETKAILKQAIQAGRALAELKLAGRLLPDDSLLINSLVLLEAKDSSEIESIFTTHDKLFQADLFDQTHVDANTKEVTSYRQALWNGFQAMNRKPLGTNVLIEIMQTIKKTKAGVRGVSGTQIVNPLGEVIYTPPEGEDRIRSLLTDLEKFIHDSHDIDPIIKMAIIHYQFEAIHPFTDGNGRTGRILNILYLVQENLLETPVLFLSRYIIDNKTPYYKGLQNVTEHQNWEEWILYMLTAVEQTAYKTIERIKDILHVMDNFAEKSKADLPKIHSKELLELLFEHPYCRIQSVMDRLRVSRQTASTKLHAYADKGLLVKRKIGTEIIFINPVLVKVLQE